MAFAATLGLGGPRSIAAPLQLVTDQWVPYENLSDAAAPGFSTESSSTSSPRWGRKRLSRSFPWARAAGLVFRGERDAIFTAFYNEERARFCYFPKEPLARDKWVFFVRTAMSAGCGFLRSRTSSDTGSPCCAAPLYRPSSGISRSSMTSRGNRQRRSRFSHAGSGRVDFVVASFVNGVRVIAALGLDGKIEPLLSRSLKEDDLFIIFSKARVSQDFVDAFSEALRQFKQTEAFQAIYRKYFRQLLMSSSVRITPRQKAKPKSPQNLRHAQIAPPPLRGRAGWGARAQRTKNRAAHSLTGIIETATAPRTLPPPQGGRG